MTRAFARDATPARIRALREHMARERAAVDREDAAGRVELLGDFHVRIAELMGNEVLAQMLGDLISRSSLISLMYQRAGAARHSQQEHVEIVKALAARDEARAVRLMDEHLLHVEASLAFDRKVPTHDIALALS
jgi:DNA-binding GntR family transcriptional regulator